MCVRACKSFGAYDALADDVYCKELIIPRNIIDVKRDV